MTHASDDQLAIVLGQRQLIAVCTMCLVVMGLVATLAYVCGRSITAAQFESSRPAAAAIMVDPTRSASSPSRAPAQPKPPAAMEAKAQTIVAPKPVVAVNTPEPQADPPRGQTFWQVGLLDRGIAAVFVEYLQRLGLKARTASGTGPNLQRVLVGPLEDADEIEKAHKTLEATGFQSFIRRY
ncbi:MAG: hypothetical protein HY235_14190 [Acidobacteria bacterium]|nr:hypothetical protein [Acidobacteriota bacterium]